jgi:cytochrome c2
VSVAAAAVAAAIAGGFAANHLEARQRLLASVRAMTGGDPEAGQTAIKAHSCGGCHQIPGVAGAAGKVGPPLSGLAGRTYIGGRLNNTPDNLTAWIIDPHAFDPDSAMPPTEASPQEARDMAAYLYTLN